MSDGPKSVQEAQEPKRREFFKHIVGGAAAAVLVEPAAAVVPVTPTSKGFPTGIGPAMSGGPVRVSCSMPVGTSYSIPLGNKPYGADAAFAGQKEVVVTLVGTRRA
jgi:hypothetical protein